MMATVLCLTYLFVSSHVLLLFYSVSQGDKPHFLDSDCFWLDLANRRDWWEIQGRKKGEARVLLSLLCGSSCFLGGFCSNGTLSIGWPWFPGSSNPASSPCPSGWWQRPAVVSLCFTSLLIFVSWSFHHWCSQFPGINSLCCKHLTGLFSWLDLDWYKHFSMIMSFPSDIISWFHCWRLCAAYTDQPEWVGR